MRFHGLGDSGAKAIAVALTVRESSNTPKLMSFTSLTRVR